MTKPTLPLPLPFEATDDLLTKRRKLVEFVSVYFNSKNRSFCEETNRCVYRSKDGFGCALGIFIDITPAHELNHAGPVMGDEVIPDTLKELGIDFLVYVQQLHDTKAFWTDTGLNTEGVEFKNKLLKKHCE